MSGSIVGEALVRVTAWGLRDRLADWLPGRVRRPVPARARDGRAVQRGPVGGPPPPGAGERRTERRDVVGRRLRMALGLLALAEIVVFVLVATWIGVGWTILRRWPPARSAGRCWPGRALRALGELRDRARTRQPAGRELGDAGLVAAGGR